MHRRHFLYQFGLTTFAASIPWRIAFGQHAAAKDLGPLLTDILKQHQLPGIAAAVIQAGMLADAGVAGVRQIGKEEPITLDNRFLIGSCTKRMTGLAVCRVIDAGQLAFETTLADALPSVKMRDEYRGVSVAQLLNFTGGIPTYTQIGPRITPIIFELKGSAAERRAQFIQHLLQEEPVVKPGSERRYSNASYVLAAYIAAQRTKRDIETLLREEALQPLGLAKAGIGHPRKEHPNEPALHMKGPNGYQPEPADRPAPAEEILLGAGGVHCTAGELARFAAYELNVAQGNDPLLKPATAKHWQELTGAARMEDRPIFGGTQWLTASYVLWPSKNRVAAVAVNGGDATEACKAVFQAVKKDA